jgi:signal transduction histidine kinase
MFTRIGHSLSLRLLGIFLLSGAVFAYASIFGLRWVYQTDELRELVNGHLSLHIEYVKQDIGNPPKIENAIAITKQVPVDIRILGPDISWASAPSFPYLKDLEFATSDQLSDDSSQWLNELEGVEFANDGFHRFLKIEESGYAIVVSTPKITSIAEQKSLPRYIKIEQGGYNLIIILFTLLLVLLTYLPVRWLFMPIEIVRRGAAEIGRGNVGFRIRRFRNDELGDLALDVNKMAEDVELMLDAKRQLLLGISHELRSPLSRLRLALELQNNREDQSDLISDLDEMEKVISTLIEAERLNGRHEGINIERASIADITEKLITDFFPREKYLIKFNFPDDMYLNADKARVILMIKNLINNALKYNLDKKAIVMVDFSVTSDATLIKVCDSGPGFSEEEAKFLGEPFYRGDPSRARHTGGTGLGLYIAKLVARAHGGSLDLDASYKAGACLIVSLPFEPII